jgi:hypothetical protein
MVEGQVEMLARYLFILDSKFQTRPDRGLELMRNHALYYWGGVGEKEAKQNLTPLGFWNGAFPLATYSGFLN